MPYFPPLVTPVTTSQTSVSFVDRKGAAASIRVPNLTGATNGLAIANAAGNMSNAGVKSWTTDAGQAIGVNAVIAFDEATSEAENKAVFVFQDDAGNSVSVAIPAPDASIFLSDGYTVNAAAGTLAEAFINAVLVHLGGTYAFTRGYFQNSSRGQRRQYITPTLSEPDDVAGDLPSGLPDGV